MTFIGLKKGDIIPIPLGSVSWWYNHGRSDLVMLFLGEAFKACLPGKISYFLLIGAIGHLSAFSPEKKHKNLPIAKRVFCLSSSAKKKQKSFLSLTRIVSTHGLKTWRMHHLMLMSKREANLLH
ncbi:hypothetical protein QQP08_008516 [Theobroma cacao]|nr:hypothetical protein QQP08_008516 [Theobroma cacao]